MKKENKIRFGLLFMSFVGSLSLLNFILQTNSDFLDTF